MTPTQDIRRARIMASTGLLLLCALLLTEKVRSQEQKSPRAANADAQVEVSIADGKQAFESRCAGCHGLDGRGGERAPDIALSAKTQQRPDDELFRIIKQGLPATGMPSFASLGDSTKNVVAYLRQLQGKSNLAIVPGSAQKGQGLFYGKARCSDCHAVAGRGGFLAAELSGFGRNRSADEIRQAITMPSSASRLGSRMTVKTRDGREYSGVVRNEDNFSIQLQSLDGGFQLFEKSELAGFSRQAGSLMPADYATTLNGDELNDLVSFLMSAARDRTTKAAASTKPKDDEDQ